jgi:hypothetical protein
MTTGLAIAALTVAAGIACGQPERPAARVLGRGVRATPVRVAPAVLEGGRAVRIGDWRAYQVSRGAHDTCRDYRVFDCYGDDNFDGIPDGGTACGLGEDNRWFFGTGYCNGFYTNDMTVAPDTIIEEGVWRADVAWQWTCLAPPGETEQCVIAIFLQNSDPTRCEDDSFDYPGWMFDLGELECNPVNYYFELFDISAIGRWTLPPSGRGSYAVMFLTDDGEALASCAQPMLWGNTGGPGWQGPEQIDDDAPLDGTHELPTECYTYSFGVCPDPLGGMAQFWGERLEPPGNRADFDGDGEADTRDVIAFLSAWRSCATGADCDVDGGCNSLDVLCYLDLWVTCRD